MLKVSSIVFLTCLGFINIFPKGCDADTCSFSYLRHCETTYAESLAPRRGNMGVPTAVRCSAANIFIRCAEKVVSDCKAKPSVPGVTQIISKAKQGIDQTRQVLSLLTCGNGAGKSPTSVVTIAIGLVFSLLLVTYRI